MPWYLIGVLLILAILILGGSHYFLYFSIVRFFPAMTPFAKKIIASAIILLPICFILTSIISRLGENVFTRAIYFISSLWFGVFAYLLMASVLVWLAVGVARLFGFQINTAVFASICFVAVAAFTAYGVRHAFDTRIKNITVSIPNLPDEWKGKKIVQLSDVHLGSVYQDGFMRKLVEMTNAEKPAMVVITGDLVDGTDGNLDHAFAILNNIQAEKGIYFITGNHEIYAGVDKVYGDLKKTKVRVMNDEVIDLGGLKLIGINYPKQGEQKDVPAVLASLARQFQGQPNIYLYHSPTDIAQAKAAGVNLQLSGHTHKGQFFPINLITKLVYKGYDYGLSKQGNYTLYTTSGQGLWGPTMRVGSDSEIPVITLK